MKIKSQVVFAAIVLLLAAGLTACGNGNSAREASTAEANTAETSTAPVGPEVSGAADASSSNTDTPDIPATPTTMATNSPDMSAEFLEGETYIEGLVAVAVDSVDHVSGDVEYPTSPPVGGQHSGYWQNCGFYNKPLRDEHAVHSLEHGAVWVTYKADASADELEYLETLAEQNSHLLVSPYSQQDSTFVLSAWGRQLALDSTSDPRFVMFMRSYLRDGPTAPEAGAACFGAIGLPPSNPLALMA